MSYFNPKLNDLVEPVTQDYYFFYNERKQKVIGLLETIKSDKSDDELFLSDRPFEVWKKMWERIERETYSSIKWDSAKKELSIRKRNYNIFEEKIEDYQIKYHFTTVLNDEEEKLFDFVATNINELKGWDRLSFVKHYLNDLQSERCHRIYTSAIQDWLEKRLKTKQQDKLEITAYQKRQFLKEIAEKRRTKGIKIIEKNLSYLLYSLPILFYIILFISLCTIRKITMNIAITSLLLGTIFILSIQVLDYIYTKKNRSFLNTFFQNTAVKIVDFIIKKEEEPARKIAPYKKSNPYD